MLLTFKELYYAIKNSWLGINPLVNLNKSIYDFTDEDWSIIHLRDPWLEDRTKFPEFKDDEYENYKEDRYDEQFNLYEARSASEDSKNNAGTSVDSFLTGLVTTEDLKHTGYDVLLDRENDGEIDYYNMDDPEAWFDSDTDDSDAEEDEEEEEEDSEFDIEKIMEASDGPFIFDRILPNDWINSAWNQILPTIESSDINPKHGVYWSHHLTINDELHATLKNELIKKLPLVGLENFTYVLTKPDFKTKLNKATPYEEVLKRRAFRKIAEPVRKEIKSKRVDSTSFTKNLEMFKIKEAAKGSGFISVKDKRAFLNDEEIEDSESDEEEDNRDSESDEEEDNYDEEMAEFLADKKFRKKSSYSFLEKRRNSFIQEMVERPVDIEIRTPVERYKYAQTKISAYQLKNKQIKLNTLNKQLGFITDEEFIDNNYNATSEINFHRTFKWKSNVNLKPLYKNLKNLKESASLEAIDEKLMHLENTVIQFYVDWVELEVYLWKAKFLDKLGGFLSVPLIVYFTIISIFENLILNLTIYLFLMALDLISLIFNKLYNIFFSQKPINLKLKYLSFFNFITTDVSISSIYLKVFITFYLQKFLYLLQFFIFYLWYAFYRYFLYPFFIFLRELLLMPFNFFIIENLGFFNWNKIVWIESLVFLKSISYHPEQYVRVWSSFTESFQKKKELKAAKNFGDPRRTIKIRLFEFWKHFLTEWFILIFIPMWWFIMIFLYLFAGFIDWFTDGIWHLAYHVDLSGLYMNGFNNNNYSFRDYFYVRNNPFKTVNIFDNILEQDDDDEEDEHLMDYLPAFARSRPAEYTLEMLKYRIVSSNFKNDISFFNDSLSRKDFNYLLTQHPKPPLLNAEVPKYQQFNFVINYSGVLDSAGIDKSITELMTTVEDPESEFYQTSGIKLGQKTARLGEIAGEFDLKKWQEVIELKRQYLLDYFRKPQYLQSDAELGLLDKYFTSNWYEIPDKNFKQHRLVGVHKDLNVLDAKLKTSIYWEELKKNLISALKFKTIKIRKRKINLNIILTHLNGFGEMLTNWNLDVRPLRWSEIFECKTDFKVYLKNNEILTQYITKNDHSTKYIGRFNKRKLFHSAYFYNYKNNFLPQYYTLLNRHSDKLFINKLKLVPNDSHYNLSLFDLNKLNRYHLKGWEAFSFVDHIQWDVQDKLTNNRYKYTKLVNPEFHISEIWTYSNKPNLLNSFDFTTNKKIHYTTLHYFIYSCVKHPLTLALSATKENNLNIAKLNNFVEKRLLWHDFNYSFLDTSKYKKVMNKDILNDESLYSQLELALQRELNVWKWLKYYNNGFNNLNFISKNPYALNYNFNLTKYPWFFHNKLSEANHFNYRFFDKVIKHTWLHDYTLKNKYFKQYLTLFKQRSLNKMWFNYDFYLTKNNFLPYYSSIYNLNNFKPTSINESTVLKPERPDKNAKVMRIGDYKIKPKKRGQFRILRGTANFKKFRFLYEFMLKSGRYSNIGNIHDMSPYFFWPVFYEKRAKDIYNINSIDNYLIRPPIKDFIYFNSFRRPKRLKNVYLLSLFINQNKDNIKNNIFFDSYLYDKVNFFEKKVNIKSLKKTLKTVAMPHNRGVFKKYRLFFNDLKLHTWWNNHNHTLRNKLSLLDINTIKKQNFSEIDKKYTKQITIYKKYDHRAYMWGDVVREIDKTYSIMDGKGLQKVILKLANLINFKYYLHTPWINNKEFKFKRDITVLPTFDDYKASTHFFFINLFYSDSWNRGSDVALKPINFLSFIYKKYDPHALKIHKFINDDLFASHHKLIQKSIHIGFKKQGLIKIKQFPEKLPYFKVSKSFLKWNWACLQFAHRLAYNAKITNYFELYFKQPSLNYLEKIRPIYFVFNEEFRYLHFSLRLNTVDEQSTLEYLKRLFEPPKTMFYIYGTPAYFWDKVLRPYMYDEKVFNDLIKQAAKKFRVISDIIRVDNVAEHKQKYQYYSSQKFFTDYKKY